MNRKSTMRTHHEMIHSNSSTMRSVTKKGIPLEGIKLPGINPQQWEPHIVVVKLVPHSLSSGEEGLQYYITEEGASVRIAFMGCFTLQGEQRVANSYSDNPDIAEGSLLQGTLGYLKVTREQLVILERIFNQGDYLAIKGWNSDIFLGTDSKSNLMMVMNIIKKDINLAVVPGNHFIPPLPKPDKRTKMYDQLKNGVTSSSQYTPSLRYTPKRTPKKEEYVF